LGLRAEGSRLRARLQVRFVVVMGLDEKAPLL